MMSQHHHATDSIACPFRTLHVPPNQREGEVSESQQLFGRRHNTQTGCLLMCVSREDWRETCVESVEKVQLERRRLVQISKTSSGLDASPHVQKGRDPRADPGHAGDYISHLAWERLSILPEEMVEVVRERMVRSPRLCCRDCCFLSLGCVLD